MGDSVEISIDKKVLEEEFEKNSKKDPFIKELVKHGCYNVKEQAKQAHIMAEAGFAALLGAAGIKCELTGDAAKIDKGTYSYMCDAAKIQKENPENAQTQIAESYQKHAEKELVRNEIEMLTNDELFQKTVQQEIDILEDPKKKKGFQVPNFATDGLIQPFLNDDFDLSEEDEKKLSESLKNAYGIDMEKIKDSMDGMIDRTKNLLKDSSGNVIPDKEPDIEINTDEPKLWEFDGDEQNDEKL